MRASRLAAVATATVAAAGVLMAPAQARPLEHDRWSDSGTEIVRECGMRLQRDFDASGMFMLQEGRAGDSTPLVMNRYRYRTVVTNLATGKWVIEQGHGVYKDLRATHLYGTVYQLLAQEVGQPFSLFSMDGERVIFDRGMLRTTFQIDTLGDADLSNDEYIEGSFSVVADRGRHPASTSTTAPPLSDSSAEPAHWMRSGHWTAG
jgi:hypothetical protein